MPDGERSLPGEGIVPAARRGHQPADPRPTTTKEYVVVGPRAVEGVKTGGRVTLTLTRDQEEHLIEAGHIKVSTR